MNRYVGIDTSTKTGLVILDEKGQVIEDQEIERPGKDPERMFNLICAVMEQLRDEDIVAIEGFGFASQSGFLLGGIGWGLRMKMFQRRIQYTEVAPAALKKFGSGKGNTKKDALAVDIYKRWGFQHKSDNVRDAYVLAQVSLAMNESVPLYGYQKEVIWKIRNPGKTLPKPTKKKIKPEPENHYAGQLF